MKKILFTALFGAPTNNTGGGNKVIDQIVSNLPAHEYRIEYISCEVKLDLQEDAVLKEENSFSKKNITKYLFNNFYPYKYLTTSSLYLKYYYKRKFDALRSHIQGGQWDVIHAHDPLSLYFLLDNPAKKILTIHSKGPAALDMTDSSQNKEFMKSWAAEIEEMENRAVKAADMITFPSRAAMETFSRMKPGDIFRDKDVRIVYNGINTEREEDRSPTGGNYYGSDDILYDIPASSIRILSVAQHIKPKNLDLLIRAVDVIKNRFMKDVFLLNVGEGPETGALKALVKELSLENEVRILRPLANGVILDLMKRFDYFVMPSERVIFDMVILEALSSGMIVIASNDGGNREIIIHGENGYLLDDLSPESIAEAVLKASHSVSANALEQIVSFDIKKIVRQYENLYSC